MILLVPQIYIENFLPYLGSLLGGIALYWGIIKALKVLTND